MEIIEKMNLEDINTIFYYGNDIVEEITKRSMDIDRSAQDNSYIFNDEFNKLVSRVTTFEGDIEKEIKSAEKAQNSDKSLEDKIMDKLVGELIKPFKKIFTKNDTQKNDDIGKIELGNIKDQKYQEIDLLKKELENLSYSICEKIEKTNQAEEELQQYANILGELYNNGKQQLEEFLIQINELENTNVVDEIEISVKNSKLNMYKRNYNQAIKKVDSIGKVYVSFINNKENRNNVIHNNQVQIFIIDEILHETIPVLNNHVSLDVDIMHAKKVSEYLRTIVEKSNKSIQDSSNSLLKSINESNDLYINGGISHDTQKLISQNNININKTMANLEGKKVAQASKNIEANNKLLENIESHKKLESPKSLKLLPTNNPNN